MCPAGKDIPAVQAPEAVVFAAAGEQPLGAPGFPVQRVAGEVRHRQAVQGDAQHVPAAVVELPQRAAVGQLQDSFIA